MRPLFIGILLVFFVTPAWSQQNRYPDPDRQTMWNNITDNMHTLGKNPKHTKQIKQRLHYQRRQDRIKSISQARVKARLNRYGR